MENKKILEEMRSRLNQVSPSLCLAKWQQVTIHLQNGHTHSCHHPITHKTPLEELAADPSALHNTKYKKRLRGMMLKGDRPPECGYCWNIEDSAKDATSDRHLKSASDWAAPYFDSVLQAGATKSVDPSYVEVSFSNTCNFRCSYCAPNISTKWMEEIKKFGPYPTHNSHNNLEGVEKRELMPLEEENNPYVEAFWKWWPTLYPSLRVFRITGGEPLLSPNTFRVMDYIAEHPNPELTFAINSNLCVPEKQLELFFTKARALIAEGKLKRFEVYTSLDTWGPQAEYIRNGLNLAQFKKNAERVLEELPGASLLFMVTFNALSPYSFGQMIDWVLGLKRRYTDLSKPNAYPVIMDTSYLHHPEFLTVKVLPDGHVNFVEAAAEKMAAAAIGYDPAQPHLGFFDFEILKLKRIADWMRTPMPEYWYRHQRKNFYLFYAEHDRRRGTNFLETFPELKYFWNYCKEMPVPWEKN